MFVAIEHKLDQLFQINVPEIVSSTKSCQQGFGLGRSSEWDFAGAFSVAPPPPPHNCIAYI